MEIIRPLRDHVLIRPQEADEKTKGGLFLPDSVREKDAPRIGHVLRCGPGIYSEKTGVLIPVSVQEGDQVAYHEYASAERVKDPEGRILLLIRDPDLVCVIEEEGDCPPGRTLLSSRVY